MILEVKGGKIEGLEKFEGKFVEVKRYKPTRTSKQNRAMHQYFRLVADALEGTDMREFFSQGFDLYWTPENVKEFLWKKIQFALLGKTHTKELSSLEVDKVYEIMAKVLAEKAQIDIPFPSVNDFDNSNNL